VALDFQRVRAVELVKVWGATRALAGVDLTFEAGKVTVVEGPNGSGKSTLLAILAQLARPTRGRVLYGDREGHRGGAQIRACIGVLAHAAMVYPDLTGRENLELFAALHDVTHVKDRVAELVERFEIGRFLDRPARTYSRGQLQRVSLARALVHAPRLLLLDEPTTGLDERSVERLIATVEAEREAGRILVLVTHDAVIAERLADVRVRLDRGRVVDTPEAA
jgi:heme exporter protein A